MKYVVNEILKEVLSNAYVGVMEGIELAGVTEDHKLREPTQVEAQHLSVFDNLRETVDSIREPTRSKLEELYEFGISPTAFRERLQNYIFGGEFKLVPNDATQFSEWFLVEHDRQMSKINLLDDQPS